METDSDTDSDSLDTGRPKIKVDEGLMNNLKPHQKEGVNFMLKMYAGDEAGEKNGGCILAHEMGLGENLSLRNGQKSFKHQRIFDVYENLLIQARHCNQLHYATLY